MKNNSNNEDEIESPTNGERQQSNVHDYRSVPQNQSVAGISGTSDSRQCSNGHIRKQCRLCELWFESQQHLEAHDRQCNSWCQVHRACFSEEDSYNHAQKERHDQCFVPECESKYARGGGWSDEKIEEHVFREHCRHG